jgi:sugar phosphate isomerase/epimerase
MLSRRTFTAALVGGNAGSAARPQQQKKWTIGANTAVTGYGLYQSFELLAKIGFPQVEIHPMGRPEPTPGKFPGVEWDELERPERRRIKAALKPFRFVTSHLPYTGLDWMSADADRRASSVRAVDIALEGSAELGASLCVLHLQPVPDDELPRRWNEYLDRMRAWGDRAQKLGTRIAVETMFPRSVRDFIRIVREADHSHVGCTIDVGHQSKYAELVARVKPEQRATPEGIRAYNDTTIAIAEGLSSKVWHYHVHDVDPSTWVEHKPLIHGFVDYKRLYAAMRAQRYSGFLLLEIGGPAGQMDGHLTDAKRKLTAWMG